MSVIHIPSRPKLDLRLIAFPAGMLLLLLVLFFRLWYIQVDKSSELADRADATRKDTTSKPAPRGLIYDRNGVLIAGLKPQVVISVVYSILAKNKPEKGLLADKLGLTPKALDSKLKNAQHSPGLPTPILVGTDPKIASSIAESPSQFPGVSVDLMPTRYYPDGTDYPHILGYVRLPDKKDIDRLKKDGIVPAAYVGKSGLEKSYEASLMGAPGNEVMEIDSKRRPIRVLQRDNPVPGSNLVLTIDGNLQHFCTQLLAEHHFKGAIVALDPKTGEVLSMVSGPTYDENKFQNGISLEDFSKLQSDPTSPMTKRAIESRFSPGSTFKIITSLAAYQTGKFDPNRPVFCDGFFKVGNRKFKCLGHHGEITFKQALEKSCNTYFSDMGWRVGDEALHKAAIDAGLGQPTGIDISGERSGLVPSKEYVQKRYKGRIPWYGGDTVNFSIGQGYLNVTPLQMCDVIAMVANNGTIYKPHLVKEIKEEGSGAVKEQVKPEVAHQVNASPEFWQTLKDALIGVVKVGTAKQAQIPSVEWGGKTGSTEHGHKWVDGKPPLTHSWFVGFAPAEDPKIAICVFVEDGGHGGDVAAPLARDVVEKFLKPTKSTVKPPVQAANSAANVLPSASISAARVESPTSR